ncbi:hypothetical protein A3195_18085 [Candidatus Thiodiazotropha endoloripes]|uniref:hypothetical protein n=1 Tax=Candidatus Thiodiazotropha endoloripes TaxID=1818881 RepID=UPI00083E0ED4|nr:hypothetical protein [Candidatus Thiodiazotropha endoloripes]ODB85497.1 hypothetical protein A3195_18085 [Candidatus Thiodiazotropha endoloripes]ODB92554.1 hypothetical protein A3194_09275 [Candidatus Thiodiazotropha endoloripes]
MNAKHSIYILTAVVLTVVLLEIGLRAFENRLSGNLNHINQIPDIAAEYEQHQGTNILFLGNSLINEAVDISQLNRQLSDDYLVKKITPDGTSLWDWNMILRNNLITPDMQLDYLVIGFAWGLLNDDYRPNPSRLGGYFSGLGDGRLLFDYGMSDFAELSEFIIGWASKLFVNREAVRNKILNNLVPNYETFVQVQNQAGAPEQAVHQTQADGTLPDYRMLNDLIDQLDEQGIKLVMIAMPIEGAYSVNEKLKETLQKRAYLYKDYRDNFRSFGALYKDGVHFNEKGREQFTTTLGKLISQELSGQ